MRKVLGVLLILGLFWVGKRIQQYWNDIDVRRQAEIEGVTPAPETTPGVLPGMPSNLEGSLEEAKSQGASSLKVWLNRYRGYLRDPRLAEIELDYVVLIGSGDLEEARRIFADIQNRIPPDSPIYPRVQQLENTFR